jgi:SPP1 gp7 family putative phage head morphogenesis protein
MDKPRIRVPARMNGHMSEEEVSIQALTGALEQFYRHDEREARGEVAVADPFRLFPGMQFAQYNPSLLVTRKGLGIFDEMRRDDQIKAALALKKHAVMATGWEIVSPEGQPPDWEPTAFVEHEMEQLKGTLEQALLEIMTSLDFGYSITEKVLADIKDGEFAGKVGLQALKTKKPHSFRIDTDAFGDVLPNGVIQEGLPGGSRNLPSDKFVLMAYQPEFGNPYGTSDLEAAYRSWWTKTMAYKWLAMYLERFGIPPLLALYNPNSFKGGQLDNLKSLLSRLQAASSGMIPRGSPDDLEMWAPEIAGQVSRVFIPALDMFNRDTARAILMPGLLGLSADAQQGSFARAKVQFDVFLLVVEFLRQTLTESIMQEQVINPLVMLNYPVDEFPAFRFLPITDDVRLDIMKAWGEMLGVGAVESRPGDERHIRQSLEFPEAEEDDIPDDGVEPTPEDEDDGPPDEDGDPDPDAPERVFQQGRMSRAVRRANPKRIAALMDAAERTLLGDLVPILKAERDRVLKRVRRVGVSQALANSIKVATAGKTKPLFRTAFRGLLAQGRLQIEAETGRKLKRMQEEPSFVPQEALAFQDAQAATASGVIDRRLREELRGALNTALKTGEPARDTQERIREIWEPFVGDPSKLRDGRPLTPWRLETIVRTNVTDALNQGRLVAARDPDLDGLVRAMQYSAIIDSRTTEICRHLDDRVFEIGSRDLSRFSPPNHFQCRSILVPILIDEEIPDGDFITPAQIGRGLELAGRGFV